MSIDLSIVCPLYNEEESVEKLVSRIVEIGKSFDFSYEIILIDDGSTDKTTSRGPEPTLAAPHRVLCEHFAPETLRSEFS